MMSQSRIYLPAYKICGAEIAPVADEAGVHRVGGRQRANYCRRQARPCADAVRQAKRAPLLSPCHTSKRCCVSSSLNRRNDIRAIYQAALRSRGSALKITLPPAARDILLSRKQIGADIQMPWRVDIMSMRPWIDILPLFRPYSSRLHSL